MIIIVQICIMRALHIVDLFKMLINLVVDSLC